MKISYQDALAYYGINGAHPGGMPLTKAVLKKEKINDKKIVLDAGCGTGETSAYLAKTFGCQVYSVDNHGEMIKSASEKFFKKNLPAKAVKANLEKLPFSDNYFDYCLAESSTIFGQVPKVLSEYFRVLKPGGILINVDMTAEFSLTRKDKEKLQDFYQINKIYTEEEWLKAFEKAGFKSCDILESATVFEALANYQFDNDDDFEANVTLKPRNPKYDQVLATHQRLLVNYGDKLGFRVIRAIKK